VHWLLAVADTRYAPGLPMLERYMEVGGSNVVAIYQPLAQTSAGRTWGREIYQRVKAHYDPNTRANVERILGLTFPSLEAEERLAARRAGSELRFHEGRPGPRRLTVGCSAEKKGLTPLSG
jgi:hypothetical protein